MKKTWFATILSAVLLLSCSGIAANAPQGQSLPVYLNGVLLSDYAFEEHPSYYLLNLYLHLPFACIARQMGYTVTYDAATDTVTAVNGNDYFQFNLRSYTSTIIKQSQYYELPIHMHCQNGTLYLSSFSLENLLPLTIVSADDGIYLYDTAAMFQTVRPSFDPLYAALDRIPDWDAYQCEGSADLSLGGGSDFFGIQLNGGSQANVKIQKDTQQCLSTLSYTPNGILSLSRLSAFPDGLQDMMEALSAPIYMGAYQKGEDIAILTNNILPNYKLEYLLPPSSLIATQSFNVFDYWDSSQKRGWFQISDTYFPFASQLRLLQISDKEYWDIDYLLMWLISECLSNLGQFGYDTVMRYLHFCSALLQPPYLTISQDAGGAVQVSYAITPQQFESVLAAYAPSFQESQNIPLLYFAQPDILVNLRVSDTAFSIDAACNVDFAGFPKELLPRDLAVHFTGTMQLTGSCGTPQIQPPEIKTTAMLGQWAQEAYEQWVQDLQTN